MSDAQQPTGWQPFSYRDPPEGVLWLAVDRPETWCDAGDDGRTVGGYTGETRRAVVLARVFDTGLGPEFTQVGEGDHGEVRDDDTVTHFLPLTPPEPPNA